MMHPEDMEAGALLILACVGQISLISLWRPGMVMPPHIGCLPREEEIADRDLGVEADETMTVSHRPWLMLK